MKRLVGVLQHELAVRQLTQRIASETAEEITKSRREHILRKQLESIQRELGELDPVHAELRDLHEKIEKLPLSDEARKEATHELHRLEHMPETSPEHGMIRTYVDWLLKLPWGKFTGKRI